MTGQIFKRCGCSVPELDEHGEPLRNTAGRIKRRQLGAGCPLLTRADGGWSVGHGTWWWVLELSNTAGAARPRIRSGGHQTRSDAKKAVAAAVELLAIADRADDPEAARTTIANLIRVAVKNDGPLPDPDEVRTKIRLGQPLEVDTTVEQWLRGWLETKKEIRPTTRLLYGQHIEHYLIPLLGSHRLDRLRVSHVQAAMDAIAERSLVIAEENAARHAVTAAAKKAWHAGDKDAAAAARDKLAAMPPFRRPAKAATVQRIRAVLRSALSDAVAQQLIGVNVAKLVNLPSGKPPKALVWTEPRVEAWHKTRNVPSPVMVWTAPQTRAFLDRAFRHRLYAMYLVIAHCGLRRGEACGARWEDIDLDAGTLDVRQQIVQIGWDTAFGDPKSDNGERTVMLAAPAVAALKARKIEQQQEAAEHGPEWLDTGLAFTNLDGTPLHPAHVTDQFTLLAREAGLPPVRLHDLRHGTATHALAAGVPLKVVSELLGHATTGITGDIYTTVVDEAKRAAATAIAGQLGI